MQNQAIKESGARGESEAATGSKGQSGPRKRVVAPGGQVRSGYYFCAFWLADQLFALDVSHVGSVVTVNDITPVPQSATQILGICNLRGTALAIVNLGAVLKFPDAEDRNASPGKRVLVLQSPKLQVGVPINGVESVHAFQHASYKAGSTLNEHHAVQGLLEFTGKQRQLAALLDGQFVFAALQNLATR